MSTGVYTMHKGKASGLVRVRFVYNGAEMTLPADWKLCLSTEGHHFRCTVETAAGKFLPVEEALVEAAMLMTSSNAHVRRAG